MTSTHPHFDQIVAGVQANEHYQRPEAFAIGLATKNRQGEFLEAFFPCPNLSIDRASNQGTAAIFAKVCGHISGTHTYEVLPDQLGTILEAFAEFEGDGLPHPNIDAVNAIRAGIADHGPHQSVIITFISDVKDPSTDVPDAYLRLHILSHRLAMPGIVNATPDGIMPVLRNVAWTSEGPIDPAEVAERTLLARLRGQPLRVYGVDKLPHMTDYVVPSGVRIADSARVRLGAYVGNGTVVMPSGFINFNAGTEGKAMIEGRVSQGVIVGEGSDLGGGSSTQGTMSGGSKVVISIGDHTLIGALAGTGISLGDDCIISAGLYVMPTTEVTLIDPDGKPIKTVRAHELSGENGLLFVRGKSGAVEARPNKKAVELNPLLHGGVESLAETAP